MTVYGRARPSDAKKQAEVQGMAINARLHEIGIWRPVDSSSVQKSNGTVSVRDLSQLQKEQLFGFGADPNGPGPDSLGTFEPIHSVLRSGAFAVYGRTPREVGLSTLIAAYNSCPSRPLAEQRMLLQQLGFSTIEGLQTELEERRMLCVAQVRHPPSAPLDVHCSATNGHAGVFLCECEHVHDLCY